MEINHALEQMRAFAEQHALLMPDDRLLVAVSGGMDSMCLLALLCNAGYEVEVAHVNYGLRSDDSEQDELVVRAYCQKLGLICHVKRAADKMSKTAVQETARNVRYAFCAQLVAERHLSKVATAHHRDDSVETILINMLRGTGLKGLTGIPVKRNNIVRPLLCFTKKEIRAIVEHNDIPYRHDASNDSLDYLRNRLRHELLPVLDRIDPAFRDRLLDNASVFSDQHAMLRQYLDEQAAACVHKAHDSVSINLVRMKSCACPEVLLYHIASPFGFNREQCKDLMSLEHQVGVHYHSTSQTMTLDRERILITERQPNLTGSFDIRVGQHVQLPNGTLSIQKVDQAFPGVDRMTEYIDADKCGPEFRLRPWRPGDRFQPLGAPGTQKIQDFLTNRKVPRPDKRNILVLTSGNVIVWVVGHRIAESAKVTDASTQFLKLHWQPVADQR